MSELDKVIDEVSEVCYPAENSAIYSAYCSAWNSTSFSALDSSMYSSDYKDNKNAEVFLRVLKDE